MKTTDFYGERVCSKYHGEGTLTQVFGEEIYITYDKGGSYIYRAHIFESGDLEFLKTELLEPFNKAYDEYVKSKDGRLESYTTWLYRD